MRTCLRSENLFHFAALPLFGIMAVVFAIVIGVMGEGGEPLIGLVSIIAWHWFRGNSTTSYLEYSFGWQRFCFFLHDRLLNFGKGLAVLFGVAGQAVDPERAVDYFVRSAAVGNPEAYAVLAWMAATGRTKRYEALHLAWLVREAKARGSKLIERLEQPQSGGVRWMAR